LRVYKDVFAADRQSGYRQQPLAKKPKAVLFYSE